MSKGYAIVTGAARGLGKAIFLQLAKEGYDLVGVYATDSSTPKMQALIDEVEKEYGVKALGLKGDIGSYDGCKAIVDFAVENMGKDIAVLINNAGVAGGKYFIDESFDYMCHTVQVDLMGALTMCHLVLPLMVERKGGDIINMSSFGALAGVPGQPVYSAAKAGLIGFSKTVAKEVAPFGIKINCIAPGAFETDMVAQADPAQRAAVMATVPMGKLGDPADVALCASYMINSTYLTGQTISPNGGVISIP